MTKGKRKNWDEKQYMHDYATILKQYSDLPTHPYVFVLTSPPLYMRTVMKEMLWDMQVVIPPPPPLPTPVNMRHNPPVNIYYDSLLIYTMTLC